jgi:hypothetical protein
MTAKLLKDLFFGRRRLAGAATCEPEAAQEHNKSGEPLQPTELWEGFTRLRKLFLIYVSVEALSRNPLPKITAPDEAAWAYNRDLCSE